MATARRPNKSATRKRRRARLAPRTGKRGLAAAEIVLAAEAPEVAPLVARVQGALVAAVGAAED
jgi:hypothetical protein